MPPQSLEYIVIQKHFLSGRNILKGDESTENKVCIS